MGAGASQLIVNRQTDRCDREDFVSAKPGTFGSRLSKPTKLALLTAILFIIGIIRLWPHYDAAASFPMHPEAIHLARSLAFDHRFADPFRLAATGPSAYLSPAFPAFLAVLIHFFGTGPAGDFAFRLAAAAATAGELSLLPLLTETLGLGSATGVLACLIALVPPILTFPEWEVSYAGLLIVIATILWWRFMYGPPRRFHAVLFGFAAGLLLLTSATSFAVLAVWFAYGVWRLRWDVLRQGRWAAPVIVLAMLTPWTLRNYLQFHRIIPFRSALGLALEASNNDCALPGVQQSENAGCFALHSPNHNPSEAALAAELGEAEYTSRKLHETILWIAAHPQRFVALTAHRIYTFWFPHEADSLGEEFTVAHTRRKERLTIYLATVLSVPGLILLLRDHRPAALVLASWLAFFPVIYYIAMFEDRYRYPILWVTFVCTAYGLLCAARRLGTGPGLRS